MAKRGKLNPRQELFARLYVEIGIARRAYVEAGYNARLDNPAGYNPADATAWRLQRNVKVAKRIQELRRAMAKRADITEDSIADELEEARQGALESKQHAAAVQATVAKAKLVGLMIDRKEIRQGEIESMTEEELRAYLAEPWPAVTHDGSPSKQ